MHWLKLAAWPACPWWIRDHPRPRSAPVNQSPTLAVARMFSQAAALPSFSVRALWVQQNGQCKPYTGGYLTRKPERAERAEPAAMIHIYVLRQSERSADESSMV